MRVVLFILMLTLLPLRGWVGDAMATNMAVAELQSAAQSKISMPPLADQSVKARAGVVVVIKSTSVHGGSAGSDCAGHTAASAAALDDADACTPCAACGACHSASISSVAPAWAAAVHGSTLPAWPADAFLSADAADTQKPPIF